MKTVTVSTKFQVVIPRMYRDTLGIKAGQKFQVIQYEDRLELIPIKKMKEMRGFLRGMDTKFGRDGERL